MRFAASAGTVGAGAYWRGADEQLSRAQARRIALVAQGFRDPRHTTPTMRTFSRTLARTGVLQVDSVNVLQRAHYMPLFSRMGPYDTEHAASGPRSRSRGGWWSTGRTSQAFMPVDLWPVMQHRMDALPREPALGRVAAGPTSGAGRRVHGQVRDRGASTARDLDDGSSAREGRLGLELVARRARRSTTSSSSATSPIAGRNQPVRAGLRPARAGAPAARPRGAGADRVRGDQGAGPPRRPLPRRGHGRAA